MNKVFLKGLKSVEKEFKKLSADQRTLKRNLNRSVAKKAVALSKAHVRQQTDITGVPWQKRASGKRKKMLVKLGRGISVVSVSDIEAVVGWRNRLMETIAAKHQSGHTETYTAALLKKRTTKLSSKDPATRRQAKALRELGYKIKKVNGRGYRTATLKWMMQNLTVGKAGAIIRSMRETKKMWKVTLPARSFLGIRNNEFADVKDTAVNEFKQLMER